ncbi:MAG: Ig-like domain-containing protein, partial [Bacillota bacterium]|nr:Ig-like domain-containing protein [Bacillota bacterium]
MLKRFRVLLIGLLVCLLLFQTLPHDTRATINPTNTGLAEFVLKALHENWGYVYGTYGQVITQSLIDSKARQYPAAFSAVKSDGQTVYVHAQKWIGSRAADCVGLAKAYLWWQDDTIGPKYSSLTDFSANGLYNRSTVNGPIETIPATHGVMVWRNGHVGIYIGNDEVIEARGVEYGVVRTRLADRNWSRWFIHPNLSYITQGWVTINGDQYYYRDGQYVTGQQVIDGKVYLFASSGVRISGFQTVDGKLVYYNGNGTMLTGWQTIGGNRYYLDAESSPLTGWQTLDGKTSLFSSRGILLAGWQSADGRIYYLDENGSPLAGTITADGRSFTLDQNGALLNGWQEGTDGWSWFGLDGQMAASGLLWTVEGTWLIDDLGHRLTGWQMTEQGLSWFDPQSGMRISGGLHPIDSGTGPEIFVFDADGSLARTGGPVYAGQNWYVCDDQGRPSSGELTMDAAVLDTDPLPVTIQTDAETHALVLANQESFELVLTDQMLFAPDSPQEPVGTTAVIQGTIPDSAIFFSLDPAVAIINTSGQVTAVSQGKTLIGVTTAGQYALAAVTVLPDSRTISGPSEPLLIEPGSGADWPLTGVDPVLRDSYRLESSDPEIVAVQPDGHLAALKTGQVTMTLSCAEEILFSFIVNVEQPFIGFSAHCTTLNLAVGESHDSPITLLPVDGTNRDVQYSSNQPLIASVTADGTIKGLTPGQAVITAEHADSICSIAVSVMGTLPLLRRGSAGEAVYRMEEQLVRLNYLAGPADDQFGALEEYAVRCLQVRMQQPQTGTADNTLQKILYDDLAPQATPVQVSGTLRTADMGEQVLVFQQRLLDLNFHKLDPDGTFSAHTAQAVLVLQ